MTCGTSPSVPPCPNWRAAKCAPKDDDSRLVWLLLRARGEDGKYRFLLQQRTDGTWGMPGGRPHIGEDPWEAAVREAGEEIGELPALRQARSFHHVEDDGETQVFLWLCDVPFFHPQLDGATPEETQGAAWFRRGEIGDLDLAPAFREDWEHGVDLREHVTKGAADASDPNPVEATHVESQLLANYPPASVAWVTAPGIHWIGPVNVPLDRIDTRDEDGWAASHQSQAVTRFAEGIKAGTGHTNPVVMVQSPENPKAIVIDGHHRYLAYRKLGRPVKAYVGMTDKITPAMLETHSSQLHQGSDPANKSAGSRTSAEVLREYWTHEGHPGPTQYALEEKIRWGDPDDWYRCCDELTPYIGAEGAKGYCNLRHHEVLGYWPAQHREMTGEKR